MEILKKAESIKIKLKDDKENPIDFDLPAIPPFIGKEIIKLIIIGQDPTIKNNKTRNKISTTLNLNKKNSLSAYINIICKELGISIENVYATNLFKYFYTIPPARTLKVLRNHLTPNLELLKQELSEYENIPVITLGQPVLQLLTNEKAKVREYWGYNKNSGGTNNDFTFSSSKENNLDRVIFPFCHQPSLRKHFYKDTLMDYIKFMKTTT